MKVTYGSLKKHPFIALRVLPFHAIDALPGFFHAEFHSILLEEQMGWVAAERCLASEFCL
jgi:hypothetical protein